MIELEDGAIRLELRGHIPAKANRYRIGWRGGKAGLRLDDGVNRELAGLGFQINAQWAGKPPLSHPEVRICFHLASSGRDRDNALKSLLDLLQQCGVIRNDNVANFNGRVILEPAVISSEEMTIVELRDTFATSSSSND